jgi:TonB-dependent SusC/RagA subfamily outer membrane receptor
MTLPLMVYGMVLGFFLAGAASFLDRGLRALGQPTRWTWVMGMALTAAAPLLAPMLHRAPAVTGQGSPIPVELLYQILSTGTTRVRGPSELSAALDQPLGLAWILASTLILLGILWTSLRLRRASRKWGKRTVGVQEVLVSTGLGPAVLGLVRPKIVLPAWALEMDPEKLEMILLHEREHQKARDPALLALGLLLTASAPWNPGLWWMARRLHLAVEGDCDRRVLARGVHPRMYGNLLLEVASGARRPSVLAPALAEGGHTFLERRLLMIRSTVRKHRIWVAALATLASGGFLLLACETPTPPGLSEEDAIALEAPAAAFDAPAPATPLAEVEEGYFLVRKTGEELEYVGSVSPEQLRLIQEGSSEAPGAFVVRERDPEGVRLRLKEEVAGTLTAAGPKPLIIVDGVIMSDPDAISSLSPDGIESVEVIKGAAAEALYGERAAGGVIRVTTKR